MSRCQHNQRIVKFCIFPNCTHPHSGGCEYCFKRYHCHLGEANYLKETQLTDIIKDLTAFEDKKVKIRPLKEAIYNYFNIIKGQLSTYLDCISSDLLNKVTYPYIQKQGYLNILKKIKHKEYNKLNTEEIIRLKEFKSMNPPEKLQNRELQAYFEQSLHVHKKIIAINNLYKQLQKEAQDSYIGESIMSVSIYSKKIQQIFQHIKNQRTSFQQKIDQLAQIPQFREKKDLLEKQQKTIQRQSQVEFIVQDQNKNSSKQSAYQVESTQQQVQKQCNLSIKKQGRQRKISIDSRCSDPLVRSRAKTFEQKEKQISQRKQRLDEILNKKKQNKSIVSDLSNGLNQKLQLKDGQSLGSSQNGKFITQSDMKYAKTKQQEEMGAHTLLPEGFDERNLYEQLPAIQKKTLKIPVSVIPQNQEQECQSPILKLKKNQKTKIKQQESSGFQFGLFKVHKTQGETQNQTKEVYPEATFNSNYSQSKSSSQVSSDKQNIIPEGSPAREMNINQKQANSIFLLAESLKLSAKKATPLLEAALKYAPHNFSAAEYLSFLYLEQNKPKQCLKTCNEALKLISGDPNAVELSVHLYNNKAASLNLLGRFSESIPILQKCIQVKKKDIFYKNLGDAFFNLGIIEKAIINYENALFLNDDNEEALYNLGVCFYLQKNFESSKLKVQKALMLDQENQIYLKLYKEIEVAIEKKLNDV